MGYGQIPFKIARLSETAWKSRIVILCLAFVGLATVNLFGPFDKIVFPDEGDYIAIAKTLVTHGVYGYPPGEVCPGCPPAHSSSATPTAFRTPGYVFFIAPELALGLQKKGINFFQIFLWVINAYLAGRIALILRGPVAAGAAILLALVLPVAAYAALTLFPQTLTATVLLLILLVLFEKPTDSISFRRAISLGILSGVALLITPALLLILAGGALVLWSLRILSLRPLLIASIVACFVLLPWIARNWIVMGHPLLATSSGWVLLLGNSTNAAPGNSVTDVSEYAHNIDNLGEIERNEYFRAAAIDWIKTNPLQAGILYFRKLLQFFNFYEQYGTEGVGGIWVRAALFLSYYPLLILAVMNVFIMQSCRLSRREIFLFLLYLGAGAAYAIFITRIRYRIPFDYIVIILAAVAVDKLTMLYVPKRQRHTKSVVST
jgi:hypothetical protein